MPNSLNHRLARVLQYLKVMRTNASFLSFSSCSRAIAMVGVGSMLLVSIGCDAQVEPGPADTIATQPRLLCGGGGLLGGGDPIGDVPGLASFLDASSVVDGVAGSIADDVRAQLEGLAQSIGMQTSSDMSLTSLAAAVQSGLLGSVAGQVEGLDFIQGLTQCSVNTDVVTELAESCDLGFDAVTEVIECLGTCVGLAGIPLACEGDAVLQCQTEAFGVTCDGACMGSCALPVVAEACGGTCTGACDGICTELSPEGDCIGSCDGPCTGTCESIAPGDSCAGDCTGECVKVPGAPGCDESETPMCEPGASGAIGCDGLCLGTLAIPGLSDECLAPVQALANSLLACEPPLSDAHVNASADVEDEEKAALEVWADDVAASMGAMTASQAQAQSLLGSTGGLLGVVEELLSTVLSLLGGLDATCVLGQLNDATATLEDAQSTLEEVIAAVEIIEGLSIPQ